MICLSPSVRAYARAFVLGIKSPPAVPLIQSVAEQAAAELMKAKPEPSVSAKERERQVGRERANLLYQEKQSRKPVYASYALAC